MNYTIIEAVRIKDADGASIEYSWEPGKCYLIRDDHPYLDFRTRGNAARPEEKAVVSKLEDPCGEGTQWQRWDFSEQISRERRLGEISLALKVPKKCVLRCYVVPTALLSHREVIAMAEDIEAEFGFTAVWDTLSQSSDRAWSHSLNAIGSKQPAELISLVQEEMRAASAIRRDPFLELAPLSRLDAPLPENAIVSHWAARRSTQLLDLADLISAALSELENKGRRHNPEKRQEKLVSEIQRLKPLHLQMTETARAVAGFVHEIELPTFIFPSPIFQRDYRLRLLLRVFAPLPSEAISEVEAARSHYPPVNLNRVWELWGMVWIARELRKRGFNGTCAIEAVESVTRCSWKLSKNETLIELDFEAEPVFVDYENVPPAHDRGVPVLEWAAGNSTLDSERPFLGLEVKCSPDYLIRITTPVGRTLVVGDACLASPEFHGRSEDRTSAKPYTVEKYRRTIGWAVDDKVVRCHSLGAFVLLPPPAQSWTHVEKIPGAADCTLLCPSPLGDAESNLRLERFLDRLMPAD